MHIIEIKEKNIKKYIPADLSECTPKQYIEMSALIFLFQIGEIEYEKFRVDAVYKLLEMKRKPSKQEKAFPDELDDDDANKYAIIFQLSELIDSFFEVNADKQREIKQYYVNNPMPTIKGSYQTFHGPSDDFNNVTFGEYVDGLEAYVNFNQTGEMIYLHELVSIFYRPTQFFSKNRRPYVPEQRINRMKQMKLQYIGIIYGFYLYFASFQKCLVDRVVFVQGNEIDLSILFNSSRKEESKIPGLGMKGVLLTMAESGVYGPEPEVRNTPMWEIIIRMYDIIKRDLDQEAAFKKATA